MSAFLDGRCSLVDAQPIQVLPKVHEGQHRGLAERMHEVVELARLGELKGRVVLVTAREERRKGPTQDVENTQGEEKNQAHAY